MRSNVRLLQLFCFLNCFRPHWPIAVIYFQEVTASYAAAMAVYSIVFLCQTCLEVPTGMFSDGFRRRRAMIIGAGSASLSITCYAIGINFWILAIGALLEGLSRALFSGTQSALLFESLPAENKQPMYEFYSGRVNSMAQLGLCLSAALCALLALSSLKLVLWVAVVPQVISFLLVLGLQDILSSTEHPSPLLEQLGDAVREFRTNTKLRLVAFAEILEFGFFEALFYFQASFFNSLIPHWGLGLMRCLNHFAGFLGFWFSGKILAYFGARRTLIVGTCGKAVIKFFAVIIPSAYSPYIIASANCIYGPCDTARNTLLQLEFNDRQRATMGSMISLLGSLLFACISTILGLVADFYSPQISMLVGISSYVFIIPLYLTIFRDSGQSK